MTRGITKEERALIDAAIEADKVTRVPPGQSAIYDYQWCPKRHNLVHKDTAAGVKRAPGFFLNRTQNQGTKRRAPTYERELFLARVREMHEAGVPQTEIAERLGRSRSTIRDACRTLGLKLNGARGPDPRARVKAERMQRLVDLLGDGTTRSARDLRQILGVSETQFARDMKTLRKAHPGRFHLARSMHERTAERRAAIREVVKGAGPVEPKALAAEHGVSLGVIYEDLRQVRAKR